jgi:hypothetical protein
MPLIPTPAPDAWSAQVDARFAALEAAVTALQNGASLQSSPPPPAGVSPDDTAATLIKAPSTATRTDKGLHVWNFAATQNANHDYFIFKDGAQSYGPAAGILLGIKGGVIYHQNTAGTWWQDTGTSWVTVANPIR